MASDVKGKINEQKQLALDIQSTKHLVNIQYMGLPNYVRHLKLQFIISIFWQKMFD